MKRSLCKIINPIGYIWKSTSILQKKKKNHNKAWRKLNLKKSLLILFRSQFSERIMKSKSRWNCKKPSKNLLRENFQPSRHRNLKQTRAKMRWIIPKKRMMI